MFNAVIKIWGVGSVVCGTPINVVTVVVAVIVCRIDGESMTIAIDDDGRGGKSTRSGFTNGE